MLSCFGFLSVGPAGLASEGEPDDSVWVACREIAAEQFTLPRVWEGVKHSAQYAARAAAVRDFNKSHVWQKRGISINPCRCVHHPASAQHTCFICCCICWSVAF